MSILLRLNDRNSQVAQLQAALNHHGAKLVADGHFGVKTQEAVVAFQASRGLTPDGVAGPKTFAALGLVFAVNSLKVTRQDISNAAAELKVQPAAVYASIEVESNGNGFLSNGDPVILYERHYLWRQSVIVRAPGQTVAALQSRRARFAATNSDICQAATYQRGNKVPDNDRYLGGLASYTRLNRAKVLCVESALESCSWGMFQIMGSHAKSLGYGSVIEFVRQLSISEGHQLQAFVRFVKADPALWRAMQASDWNTVARLYNGKNYAQHGYHTKLRDAFIKHGGR